MRLEEHHERPTYEGRPLARPTEEVVALTMSFVVDDRAESRAEPGRAFEGAAVSVWHCDGQARYSMYTEGVEDETWLRGVQVADAKGAVSFTTILPGCYAGRWPHIHLEVYPVGAGDVARLTVNVDTTTEPGRDGGGVGGGVGGSGRGVGGGGVGGGVGGGRPPSGGEPPSGGPPSSSAT